MMTRLQLLTLPLLFFLTSLPPTKSCPRDCGSERAGGVSNSLFMWKEGLLSVNQPDFERAGTQT